MPLHAVPRETSARFQRVAAREAQQPRILHQSYKRIVCSEVQTTRKTNRNLVARFVSERRCRTVVQRSCGRCTRKLICYFNVAASGLLLRSELAQKGRHCRVFTAIKKKSLGFCTLPDAFGWRRLSIAPTVTQRCLRCAASPKASTPVRAAGPRKEDSYLGQW
jgi:hypothetical protein